MNNRPMIKVISIYFSMRRMGIKPAASWKFAIGQGIKLEYRNGN